MDELVQPYLLSRNVSTCTFIFPLLWMLGTDLIAEGDYQTNLPTDPEVFLNLELT